MVWSEAKVQRLALRRELLSLRSDYPTYLRVCALFLRQVVIQPENVGGSFIRVVTFPSCSCQVITNNNSISESINRSITTYNAVKQVCTVHST